MTDMVADKAYLVVVDRHIAELEERIHALKNRIAAMIVEKYEIRNQEVLLSAMLETRNDLEQLRSELERSVIKPHDDLASRAGI